MADLSMIVRMVIYRCREISNPVTETLAAYVAQTTMNQGKSMSLLALLLAWLQVWGAGRRNGFSCRLLSSLSHSC